MHAGKRFHLKEVIYWTRRDLYVFFLIALLPTALYQLAGFKWLVIPWVAIGLIGTAAAFVVGFKNTQTYNRLWEARQIWGSIVNSSRSWGIFCSHMIDADAKTTETLIYRHLAWITALRYQLREPRIWENSNSKSNVEYGQSFTVPERTIPIHDVIDSFLSKAEIDHVFSKTNKATQIIHLQSTHLKQLKEEGKISALNFIELEKMLADFYDQQGRCERIKNFPYPRQFATVNQMFIRLFIFILPFGFLQEFEKLSAVIGDWFIWCTVPCTLIVAWVFFMMEKMGESTENPFEGIANDVPISNISRTIEIDLREMLNETDIPAPTKPQNNILM